MEKRWAGPEDENVGKRRSGPGVPRERQRGAVEGWRGTEGETGIEGERHTPRKETERQKTKRDMLWELV